MGQENLTCWHLIEQELSIGSKEAANQTMDLTNLNEAVKTMKKENIDAFSSKILHTWTKTMSLGSNMHVMMQSLEEEEGCCLPHGWSVMNLYTEMTTRRQASCSFGEE